MRRRFINNVKNNKVDYNDYMTIEAINDVSLHFIGRNLSYSYDCKIWYTFFDMSTLNIDAGKQVFFKCNLTPGDSVGSFSTKEGQINLKGNCLSLIFGDNAREQYSIAGFNHVFSNLFRYCNIMNVDENFLQATTLEISCYNNMFASSTLITAPVLPAISLKDSCYHKMFNECHNLNYIKMLATDISAYRSMDDWVYDVSPTGTFVKNPEATWEVYGNSGIPEGWTVKMDGEENLFPAILIPADEEGNATNASIATYFLENYPNMVVSMFGQYTPIVEDVTIEGSNFCDGKVIGVAKWSESSSYKALLFYTQNGKNNFMAFKVILYEENSITKAGLTSEWFFD